MSVDTLPGRASAPKARAEMALDRGALEEAMRRTLQISREARELSNFLREAFDCEQIPARFFLDIAAGVKEEARHLVTEFAITLVLNHGLAITLTDPDEPETWYGHDFDFGGLDDGGDGDATHAS